MGVISPFGVMSLGIHPLVICFQRDTFSSVKEAAPVTIEIYRTLSFFSLFDTERLHATVTAARNLKL